MSYYPAVAVKYNTKTRLAGKVVWSKSPFNSHVTVCTLESESPRLVWKWISIQDESAAVHNSSSLSHTKEQHAHTHTPRLTEGVIGAERKY